MSAHDQPAAEWPYVNDPMWWPFFFFNGWRLGIGLAIGRDVFKVEVGPFEFGVERVYELVMDDA